MLSEPASSGSYAEVERLLQTESVAQLDLDVALRKAVYGEHEAVVRLLLDRGADPNFIADGLWSALLIAVEQMNEPLVRLLVSRGADVNLACDGWSPLHNAVDIDADSAWQAQTPAVPTMTRLLLELGAKPIGLDRSGRSAKDIAREYEFNEAIELLDRYGAK